MEKVTTTNRYNLTCNLGEKARDPNGNRNQDPRLTVPTHYPRANQSHSQMDI